MAGDANVCDACGNRAEVISYCKKCLDAKYCSAKCQKAKWGEHKLECKKFKLMDMNLSSPLLALAAWLPHTSTDCLPARYYQVNKKVKRGLELHLYLSNKSNVLRNGPDFDPLPSLANEPSGPHLAMLVQHDGPVLPRVVGTLTGFHAGLQRFNQQSKDMKVSLSYMGKKVHSYSICVGWHNADRELVYHYDGQVKKYTNANKHAWIVFSFTRTDAMIVDCFALPMGFMLGTNVMPYLPSNSQAVEMYKSMGGPGQFFAPLFAADKYKYKLMQQVTQSPLLAPPAMNSARLFEQGWREERRVNVSERSCENLDALMMDTLAEVLQVKKSDLTEEQKQYCREWFGQSCQLMTDTLHDQTFLGYPTTVPQAFPGGFNPDI